MNVNWDLVDTYEKNGQTVYVYSHKSWHEISKEPNATITMAIDPQTITISLFNGADSDLLIEAHAVAKLNQLKCPTTKK